MLQRYLVKALFQCKTRYGKREEAIKNTQGHRPYLKRIREGDRRLRW